MGWMTQAGADEMALTRLRQDIAGSRELIEQQRAQMRTDRVLSSSLTPKGTQVPNAAIVDVAASKVTGTIATTQVADDAITNAKLANAAVGTAELIDANVTTVKIADANVTTAKIADANVTDAKIADMAFSKNTGNYAFANRNTGFFGAAAVVQQTRGGTLANNLTSGGTTDQLDDYADLLAYSNDAAAIRNNLFQLGRAVRLHDIALRALGLET